MILITKTSNNISIRIRRDQGNTLSLVYSYSSYLNPRYLVLPPLLPCCSLDYLGWQLLDQPGVRVCVYVYVPIH